MEDNQPTPLTTTPPAARTAQALRELHDRARTALAAQRERMVLLESQLTHQLDSIADTLAEQIASHGGAPSHAQQPLEEVARLRTELEQTRVEWTAERDAWQVERAQLAAADSDRSQSLDQRQQELEARQRTLDDRTTTLNHQDRELRQRQEQLNATAVECAAQQSQLSEAESTLEKQRADLAEREAAVQRSHIELDQTQGESVSRLASLEQQLNTERAAWDRERANVEEQRRLLAKERDDLSTALEAARGELATAREHAAAAGERDELQQKFDLALADVQRLRARVAELEQELASRSAPAEMDPVELVHVRAERDALAERVVELEQKTSVQGDADTSQEQADLQRRFELAVEDVRDLKKKNAELETQVAAAKSHAAPAALSSGGGSWEAMKMQMLADLADEGDNVDEERQQDRATIESTIRITDEALTCKDREIAELKSRLAESAHLPSGSDQAADQLVDADEVIAGHRARIAELEKEMTEKLRTAELEISVERATIARETAHLEELKAEIDAQRASGEVPGVPGGVQQPKRRWLSKLGLSGEDEEK